MGTFNTPQEANDAIVADVPNISAFCELLSETGRGWSLVEGYSTRLTRTGCDGSVVFVATASGDHSVRITYGPSVEAATTPFLDSDNGNSEEWDTDTASDAIDIFANCPR